MSEALNKTEALRILIARKKTAAPFLQLILNESRTPSASD